SYSLQMKIRNKANTPMTVLLNSEIDDSGWTISIEGKSGSPLIELGAFEEETFTVDVTVPDDANNGDKIPIIISASPLDIQQSFSDEFTAEFTLNAVIEISSISEIIINELTHPRLSTLILGLVTILILFAGVQSRMNKRKWAAQMTYLEMVSNSENNVEIMEEVSEIPSPVLTLEDTPVDRYADEDVELV
ncbi:MAG: COG1470 family protein, partial [Candidatus Poseidoniales archaeon]